MLRWIVGLAVVATLALAGSARAVILVNPAEALVGGQWQQWANESRAPTYDGLVVFQSSPPTRHSGPGLWCASGVTGCANEIDGTFYLSARGRSSLYYELGHIFDWAVLTPYDRWYLAWRWDSAHEKWWDSDAAAQAGYEDGLEGIFSMVYEACAYGHQTTDTSYGELGSDMPSIYTGTFHTCTYLKRLVAR